MFKCSGLFLKILVNENVREDGAIYPEKKMKKLYLHDIIWSNLTWKKMKKNFIYIKEDCIMYIPLVRSKLKLWSYIEIESYMQYMWTAGKEHPCMQIHIGSQFQMKGV